MAIAFKHRVLDNGLTVVAECDQAAHTAAVGYFVRTGARDESGPVMGVSHFLEHMMFKGTDRRSAEQLNRDFDRIGARNNAYTSSELTCFYASVLPEHLSTANEIIADMMRPALRSEDFDMEKGVILEEIAMYDDNPFWVLYERMMESRYGRHPLGHRVLGTAETITALSVRQMREYFAARYSADNTVVALAGRVDFDAVCEQVAALCGAWARTDAQRDASRPEFRADRLAMKDETVSRAYLMWMSEGPGFADQRRYAAALLGQVLGGADNSRLHWSLIETGKAEEAEASYDAHDGVGDFFISCSCDPGRVEEVCEVVEQEVRGLGASVSDEDLERIRARAATAATVGGERPGGRMQRLGRQWTYLGSYTTLEEELDRINAVGVEDLRDILEAFPFEPMAFGALGPA